MSVQAEVLIEVVEVLLLLQMGVSACLVDVNACRASPTVKGRKVGQEVLLQ